jgi:hypothetical protein
MPNSMLSLNPLKSSKKVRPKEDIKKGEESEVFALLLLIVKVFVFQLLV